MSHETHWREERLFLEGDDFFASILQDISNSRESIDVETYIFELDRLGTTVLHSLMSAARRGVRVRLLIDAFGSSHGLQEVASALKEAGVLLRLFQTFKKTSWLHPLRDYNRRNHRKSWIFDRCIAYVSSMNISSNHSFTDRGSNSWRDYGLRFSGKSLAVQALAFERSWNRCRQWHTVFRRGALHLAKAVRNPRLVRLNTSPRMREIYYEDFIERIRSAQHEIWFASGYFAPETRLAEELSGAALRGCDVRILISRKSDLFFMPWVAMTYFSSLIESGVKIYEYLPRVFHGKVCVIDDWTILGSSNLNHRSLLHDLEVDVLVTHSNNQIVLRHALLKDFSESSRVSKASLEKIGLLRRILARIFLSFSHWL